MNFNHADRLRTKKIIFSILIIFFVLLIGALMVALKQLLMPIFVGWFLAYLFKPLVQKNFFPGFPKWIGTSLIFLSLGGGIFWIVKTAIARRPDEVQKMELMIRAKYRLNQKYQQ